MSHAAVFQEIPARERLKVPLAPAAVGATAGLPRAGTIVQRAEPLGTTSPAGPAVLAPMAGVLGEVDRGVLTSGQEVSTVSLEALSEAEAAFPVHPSDGAARLRGLLAEARPAHLSRYTDALRLAGVSADRWTSPDLLGQLHQCLKRPVDTVVCSALDFDGALPLQESVACAGALEIVAAVAVLGAATGATRGIVVVDAAADGSCVRSIERWAPQTGVRVVTLRNDYPQPNPTLLLHTLTRRPLRPGHLPTEAGALLLDALAAAAAGRALLYGEPLLRTPLGVVDMRATANAPASRKPGAGSDGAPRPAPRPRLLSAPVGMGVADVLREAGVAPGAFDLRGGSPIRDVRLPPTRCVVSAAGEAALYLVAPQPHVNPDPCIRCGWCVSGCPVHIHPAGILQAAQTRDPVAAERYGIESCIECGVCSYVCPSHLPLLGGIRSLRAGAR